jgi:hypothetical protein
MALRCRRVRIARAQLARIPPAACRLDHLKHATVVCHFDSGGVHAKVCDVRASVGPVEKHVPARHASVHEGMWLERVQGAESSGHFECPPVEHGCVDPLLRPHSMQCVRE